MFEYMQYFYCNNFISLGDVSMKVFFEMKIKMKCSTAALLITSENVLQSSFLR